MLKKPVAAEKAGRTPQGRHVAKQLEVWGQGGCATLVGGITGSQKLCALSCAQSRVRVVSLGWCAKADFLVFLQVDAETLGHAVEGSAVDAEDLSGLTAMMFGDVENMKKVAAF